MTETTNRMPRFRAGLPRRHLFTSALERLSVLTTKYRGLAALCDQGVISITNFVTAMLVGRADVGIGAA